MNDIEANRPRNVDWRRAAALLYGDWGTSKAYVIGLAFMAAGFSSLPLIIAVCVLTMVVGFNYLLVCKFFPDGGGVYSAARAQGRLLAVIGALLLVADLVVTAALSGWEAMKYLGVPDGLIPISTMLLIAVFGVLNSFGPKHSGSIAIWLAVPTLLTVLALIGLSVPHLSLAHLQPPHESFNHTWIAFVGVILALSGVEAIANLTGVMPLDKGSTPEHPKVTRTSLKAILPVALEVGVGTAILGWAMLSMNLSHDQIEARHEDMLRFMGEYYSNIHFGPDVSVAFGWVVGIVFALLLMSAVNTAIAALIGLIYMMGRDGEMPSVVLKLNRHGVPWIPLILSVAIPCVVLMFTQDLNALAGLYAIGVVGAIALNLGCCTFNMALPARWFERGIMGATALILAAVWFTLAKTKPDALFFVMCVLGLGLSARALSHRISGIETVMVTRDVAKMVTPDALRHFSNQLVEGQKMMVAARGITPVLAFALDEAQLRKASLYVLYVKEVAILMGGRARTRDATRWQDDPQASAIMQMVKSEGEKRGVAVVPVYAVSQDPPATILDLAATLGVDYLFMGASHRKYMTKLLKGNVVTEVAAGLPEEIKLIIYG